MPRKTRKLGGKKSWGVAGHSREIRALQPSTDSHCRFLKIYLSGHGLGVVLNPRQPLAVHILRSQRSPVLSRHAVIGCIGQRQPMAQGGRGGGSGTAVGHVQHTPPAHGSQTSFNNMCRHRTDQDTVNLIKRNGGYQQIDVVFDDRFKNKSSRACFEKLYSPRSIHHVHSKPLPASLGGSISPKSQSMSVPQ